MARSHGRSAAVLAVGVLSALGNAQGYYGGDQSTCDSSDAFVDIGCFSGNNQPLYTPFIVENYDPAALTHSFPGYVGPGNNFNSTVTPLACTTVCRGYGYRTASLRDNVCACGYGIPNPFPPTTSGVCDVPCAGDASQLCGGTDDTHIFLDPSFADPDALATAGAPALAEYYQYLGCFNQRSSFPTNDAANTVIVVDSIELCLERCAAIRYPLTRATKTGNQVTCECGETFTPDDYRVVEDDAVPAGSCSVGCVTGVSGDCDPNVERCCGAENNFPVYINPELLGCHVPTIPGYGQFNANGGLTGFICANVPATLTSGPHNLTTGTYPNAVATITAAPLPSHLLSVTGGAAEFFERGCYIIMNPSDVFTVDLSNPTLGPLTLEDCAAACSGYQFFGVEGGDSCYCANEVDPIVPLDAMSSCNVRCEGNDLQLCGGDSVLKVYAVEAEWNNDVYTSIQSTVISTPYPAGTCTVAPTSTAPDLSTVSGTSTLTTSSTTTTTATTTQTALGSGTSSESSTVDSVTETGVPSSTGGSSSNETDESSSMDASGSATATDASSGSASSADEPTSTDASSGSASATEEPTSTDGSATGTEEPTSLPYTTGGSETSLEVSAVETATGDVSTGTGSAAPTGSTTEEPTGTGSAEPTGTDSEEQPTATGTEEPTSAPLTTGGSETGTDTFESSATSAPFGNSTDATGAPTAAGLPTGTGASTTTPSSTPTAPPATEQFIFSVAPPANASLGRRANSNRSLRHAKRQFQVGDGFVGGAGPLNPTDCTLATPFVFNADGTLTSGDEYVSTDLSVAYQPFWTNAVTGAITTTFAVRNGGLVWLNDAFVGGQAGFCQDNEGLVWVTFDQNPPPFDCVAVVLVPFAASQCADTGTLVPGGPTTLPSLPVPSLPVPSLPVPSLPVPSLPVPSLPVAVPVPAPTGTGTSDDTATLTPIPTPTGTGDDTSTLAPIPIPIPSGTDTGTGTGGGGGDISTNTPSTGTGSVTVGPDDSTTTLAPTACSTGACLGNGTLILGAGTFFADAVAAATDRPVAECYVRSESWVFGETTLLPRTTTVV